jgi:hypothetical protein
MCRTQTSNVLQAHAHLPYKQHCSADEVELIMPATKMAGAALGTRSTVGAVHAARGSVVVPAG